MRSTDELLALVDFARKQGMPNITVDGVTFNLTVPTAPVVSAEVPELKAAEIITPLSVLDDLDEDEITYWATPFYDELQARKEALKQSLA